MQLHKSPNLLGNAGVLPLGDAGILPATFLEAFTNWLKIEAPLCKDGAKPINPPYSLSNTRSTPNSFPYSLITEPIRE